MTPPDFRPSPFIRLYSLIVRVSYPKRFRARFEEEMTDAVQKDHEAASAKGAGAAAAFWTRTAAEAVYFGAAQRRGGGQVPGPRPSPWRLDWRDAYRSLRATPVVTVVAVISLALGIGANAALFSILNSLTFKTLPVSNPQQLVVIDGGSWTNPIWEQIRDRHVFSEVFAWSSTRFNLADHGANEFVPGDYASGAMFQVLGLRPAAGRFYTTEDDVRSGGPFGPVTVIGYDFWQRRYDGRADAIGKTIVLNHLAFTIVGVTPKGFFGPEVGAGADVFIPIDDSDLIPGRKVLDGRSTWWLEIMARLPPGQTLANAQDALRAVQPSIRAATLPLNWSARDQAQYLNDPQSLLPAASGESDLRTTYVAPLTIVLIIVGSVLLIACANIANLLLARATARQHEMSLRLALGASRARVAKQLLTESAMIAVAGSLLGLVFAQWASAMLVRQLGPTVALDLSPDWRVFAFTAGAAVVTAVLFGLAPVIGIVRIQPGDALRAAGRVTGDRHQRVRHALVIGQVALSLALVLGGGLFVRTFTALTSVPLGFDADRLFVLDFQADRLGKDTAGPRFQELLDRVQSVPGVEGAALSAITPAGSSRWNTLIEQDPARPAITENQRIAWVNAVSPGYFRTYGTPLLQGRDFDAHDSAGAALVAVVNQAFVERFLAGAPPLGAVVRSAADSNDVKTYRVIGVVGNSMYESMRKATDPIVYLSRTQTSTFPTSAALTVRSAAADPGAVMSAVARVGTEDLREGTFTMWRVSDRLGGTVRRERLVAILAGFFGGLALLLAALGLYGVTLYSVNRRRTEIGIRMALGADRAGVVQLVVGRVVWLVAGGIVAGAALSYWAGKYVTTLLFDVTARDPIMFVAAASILMASALLAGWLPARRAASVDPASVLRE
jgi:putative ABC transport system permease protein